MIKESEIGTKYKICISNSGKGVTERIDSLYVEYYPKYLIICQEVPSPYELSEKYRYCNCFIIKDIVVDSTNHIKNIGSIFHTESVKMEKWKQSFCEAIKWLQNYISNETSKF